MSLKDTLSYWFISKCVSFIPNLWCCNLEPEFQKEIIFLSFSFFLSIIFCSFLLSIVVFLVMTVYHYYNCYSFTLIHLLLLLNILHFTLLIIIYCTISVEHSVDLCIIYLSCLQSST